MTKHPQFPPQNRNYSFLQANRGTILGSIWSSFGIDLQTNIGAIRLGRKMVINTDDTTTNFGLPVAFEYFEDRWWTISGARIFRNSSEKITDTFAEDSVSGSRTDFSSENSDLALFNGRLWATSDANLISKIPSGGGSGSWTSRDAISTGAKHKLQYFKILNRLYYLDTPMLVSSIDNTDAVANTGGNYCLDIGNSGATLSTMCATDTDLFIAIEHTDNNASSIGTTASILLWDGISPQASREFKIGAGAIIAMYVKDNIPYAIDSYGRILKYTSYGFTEFARFPTNNSLLTGALENATTQGRFVHMNGITETKNNTLLIAVNNLNDDNAGTRNENLPSGIWELDLSNQNLTHKHPFTLKTINGSNVDYGQNSIYKIGAVKSNPFNSDSTSGRSGIIAGATVYTDISSTKSALFVEAPATNTGSGAEGQRGGYFVTTFFASDDIADKWGKIWATYKRFNNDDDKIVFKYRLEEEEPVYADITFSTTTEFTSLSDLTAYDGYEMEVISGTASGLVGHIDTTGFPYIMDNPAPTGTNGTARVRLQKWTKMLPEISGQDISYGKAPIGVVNTRIQIKCVMQFTNDREFYKFILATNTDVESIC